MFGMLSKLNIEDSELDQIKPMLSKIDGLKIMIIEKPDSDDSLKINYKSLTNEIMNSVSKLNYQELMTVNNKDAKIKFLSNEVSNGLMDNLLLNITSDDNTLLMMLDGKLSMDDVNNFINETQNNANHSEEDYSASSNVSTEERKVGKFTGIEVSAGIKINFTQDNNQKVVVETDPGKTQYIKTVVEGGILKISIDNKEQKNLKFKKILVTVSAPHLDKIKASSGSSFATMNTVYENNFNIEVQSGASLNGNLKAKNSINVDVSSGSNSKIDLETATLYTKATSGSSITLTGSANHANYETSSAANINAQNISVKTVEASVSSGADLKLNVTEKLDADASSGGSIRYTGSVKNRNTKSSSGGSIKPIH